MSIADFLPGPAGAASDGVAITASDTTVYDPPLRRLWVGGAGDVSVRFAATGNIVTYKAVPNGQYLDIVVDQVRAATTATNIVGER